jgi:homogentisate phytyltransferase / homogentisate geranylgeranyltransferase
VHQRAADVRIDAALPQVLWSKVGTVVAHAGMGALLFWRARQTDLQSSKSIYACYMFVWKLFYAEYLLLPLVR